MEKKFYSLKIVRQLDFVVENIFKLYNIVVTKGGSYKKVQDMLMHFWNKIRSLFVGLEKKFIFNFIKHEKNQNVGLEKDKYNNKRNITRRWR